MDVDTEKIFGYVLLGIGLVCILLAFNSMRNVFIGLTLPPEIFQLKSLSFSASQGPDNPPTAINMALDPEVRKITNMFLYYLFMFFIVLVGSKVSSLGIQLIKEIKVEVKNQG